MFDVLFLLWYSWPSTCGEFCNESSPHHTGRVPRAEGSAFDFELKTMEQQIPHAAKTGPTAEEEHGGGVRDDSFYAVCLFCVQHKAICDGAQQQLLHQW
jgi:hypothetical protein